MKEATLSSVAPEVREIGYIKSLRKFIVTARGLPSCFNNQIVEFENGVLGLVVGFREEEVDILVLGSSSFLRLDDEIYNKGQSFYLPAGDAFLGRVVNSLSEPVDGLGPIESSQVYPVFSDAPGVIDRVPVHETFETGTIVLDALIPIAKGQRQLFVGDRLSGKSSVAIDAILNQRGKDVLCIYCCIGKPYSNLLKFLDLFQEREVMPYTIVVSSVASTSVGEQYLAPYTAAMLGEYFMHQGKDVLVVFDDLTRHAWAYRQISLLLQRAPGREAYPGDIFYIHSQLVEKAGSLKPELNGGSMTFFPIAETLAGDITGYIPTNLVSMTDGQTYFDLNLFHQGVKPAIDTGLSVSRIGNIAQWPAMRELSKNLRLDYVRYQELLRMTRLHATTLSKEAEQSLKHGEVLTQLIIQDKNQPVPMEEQIIYLAALNLGVLDSLSSFEVLSFKKDFFKFIREDHPEVISELRDKKKVSEEMREKLKASLKDYFKKSLKK